MARKTAGKALLKAVVGAFIITGAHAAGHYLFGNPEAFSAAAVNFAGSAVFVASFAYIYFLLEGWG